MTNQIEIKGEPCLDTANVLPLEFTIPVKSEPDGKTIYPFEHTGIGRPEVKEEVIERIKIESNFTETVAGTIFEDLEFELDKPVGWIDPNIYPIGKNDMSIFYDNLADKAGVELKEALAELKFEEEHGMDIATATEIENAIFFLNTNGYHVIRENSFTKFLTKVKNVLQYKISIKLFKE